MKRILLSLVLILLGLVFYLSHQSADLQQAQGVTSQVAINPAKPAAFSQAWSEITSSNTVPNLTAPLPQRHSENLVDNSGGADKTLSSLPSNEQKSLWKAYSEARREVRLIPESRAGRTENLGYDFYALHPKQNMTTRFGSQGVQFVSSNRTYTEDDIKNPTTAWQAQMRLLAFAGEEVFQGAKPEKSEQRSSLVEFHHSPELIEWFDNGVEGIEHGYTIAARPSNLSDGEDVLFEVTLDGLQASDRKLDDGSQSLIFMDGDREVLSYSKLLVVDAHGKELPATMRSSEAGFTLAYNDASAVYPVTVDPLIVNEEANLNRGGSFANDHIGYSVAISGNTVVIGAPDDDDGGLNSGSAFVFVRSGSNWSLQGKLNADFADAGDLFGYSVAISGDSVAISATGDDFGSAYVFVRSGSTWSQQGRLTAADADSDDQFGVSVAISGDSVVVGADRDEEKGFDSGSAYVFVRSGSTWSQQSKLTATDDRNYRSFFGRSVAISGDSVVVGASLNTHGCIGAAGAAYVFVRSGNTWSQQAKLTAADAGGSNYFGGSVAISGSSVIVGATGYGTGASAGGSSSGAAYVFVRSGSSWSQQVQLTAGDAAAYDHFGNQYRFPETPWSSVRMRTTTTPEVPMSMCATAAIGRSRENSLQAMLHLMTSLEGQWQFLATLWSSVHRMTMPQGRILEVLMCLYATEVVGRSRTNLPQVMPGLWINLETQWRSLVTRQLLEHIWKATEGGAREAPTFLCAMAVIGRSKASSPPQMLRLVTALAIQ